MRAPDCTAYLGQLQSAQGHPRIAYLRIAQHAPLSLARRAITETVANGQRSRANGRGNRQPEGRAQANAVRENGLSPWGLRALAKTAVDGLYPDSRHLVVAKVVSSRACHGMATPLSAISPRRLNLAKDDHFISTTPS